MMMIMIIVIIIMAKEQYVKWHDRVCVQIHCTIRQEIGVKLDRERWYEHTPKFVETIQDSKVTMLWDHQVKSDRLIPNNKPRHHNP
jgi:hypothetical protein